MFEDIVVRMPMPGLRASLNYRPLFCLRRDIDGVVIPAVLIHADTCHRMLLPHGDSRTPHTGTLQITLHLWVCDRRKTLTVVRG